MKKFSLLLFILLLANIVASCNLLLSDHYLLDYSQFSCLLLFIIFMFYERKLLKNDFNIFIKSQYALITCTIVPAVILSTLNPDTILYVFIDAIFMLISLTILMPIPVFILYLTNKNNSQMTKLVKPVLLSVMLSIYNFLLSAKAT